MSDDDHFVLWPGPKFDPLNPAAIQLPASAPEQDLTDDDRHEAGDHAERGSSPCAWARDTDEKASTMTESRKRCPFARKPVRASHGQSVRIGVPREGREGRCP